MCKKSFFFLSTQVVVLMLFVLFAGASASSKKTTKNSTAKSSTSGSYTKTDEATLTVLGSGETEEKATLQALRSAIEQTYGTFVSSNTTILNDELVKDEIVSVSSGNVKNYQKLNVTTMPNGQVAVSLKATVSISNLISYAQSKGETSIQFNGNAIAANIKMMELRTSSTKKALTNLNRQLSIMAQHMYDFGELKMAQQPTLDSHCHYYYVYFTVSVYTNDCYYQCLNFLLNNMRELSMSSSDYEFCIRNGISCSKIGYTNYPDGRPSYRPSEIWYFPVSADYVMSIFGIFGSQKGRCKIVIPEQLTTGEHYYGCGRYGIQRVNATSPLDISNKKMHTIGTVDSRDDTFENTKITIEEFDDGLRKIQNQKNNTKKACTTRRLIQTTEYSLTFPSDKLSDFDIKLEY